MNEHDDDFEFQQKMEAEDRRLEDMVELNKDQRQELFEADEEFEAEWRAQGREDNEPCDDDFQ